MTDQTSLKWSDVQLACQKLVSAVLRIIDNASRDWVAPVYGVPRGGVHIAQELTKLSSRLVLVDSPEEVHDKQSLIIVDDLIDSGRTRARYTERYPKATFLSAFHKPNGVPIDDSISTELPNTWIVFPWETAVEECPEDAVTRMLQYIGENPAREGLLDTPKRVCKAFKEMTIGYKQDPAEILKAQFTESCNEMVVLRNIEFSSLCEHHMLPFSGTACVAYVPGEKVVGLSKLARLVLCYAKRLQIQERLTNQIVDALMTNLNPLGAGCIIAAHHGCMSCRGVGQNTSVMITSAVRGIFRDQEASRAEFIALRSQL